MNNSSAVPSQLNLVRVEIDDVKEGVLDPGQVISDSVQVVIPFWSPMQYQDEVFLTWQSDAAGGTYSDDFFISRNWGVRDVSFYVPISVVRLSLGHRVTVSYRVIKAGQASDSVPYDFDVDAGFEGDMLIDFTSRDYLIVDGRPPLQVPDYARVTRAPDWGRPPYQLSSENPAVATVDSQGTVTALGNGSTRIIARDQLGNQQSYAVTVQGIATIVFLVNSGNWTQMHAVCNAAGVAPVSLRQMQSMWALYRQGITGTVGDFLNWPPYDVWTGDSLGANTAYAYDVQGNDADGNIKSYNKTQYLQVVGALNGSTSAVGGAQ